MVCSSVNELWVLCLGKAIELIKGVSDALDDHFDTENHPKNH